MTYLALGICLSLIGFGVTSTIASLGLALLRKPLGRAAERLSSSERATLFLILRLFPSALAMLFVGAILLPAYSTFEPRDTEEPVGLVLVVLACGSAWVLLGGVRRGVASWLATRRMVSSWLDRAEAVQPKGLPVPAYRIESDFPIATVVGIFRPRLFLARKLFEACAPAELSAMVAHESAHLRASDNLKQLLLRFCPDFLAPLSMASVFEEDWRQACEEAADDLGAGGSPVLRLDLAAALLKVARLASPGASVDLLTSAFYRGEDVARRVTRLLSPGPRSRGTVLPPSALWLALGVLLPLFAMLASDVELLHSVHQATERVVALLP